MKVSKNILLAVLSVALSTPAFATDATAATSTTAASPAAAPVAAKKVVRKAAPKRHYAAKGAPKAAEKPQAVTQTSQDPVVRSSNGLKVSIVGEVTGLMANPIVKSNAKMQNGGVRNGAIFGVDETGIGILANGYTPSVGGLDYGAKVTLTMDKYGQAGATVLKDSYLVFGSPEKWGTLYFGNLKGAEYRTVNSVTPILGGLGSFMYNNWGDYVNFTSGIDAADLTMVGSTSRAAKVMWTSPRVAGFMLLLSYAPNSLLQSLAGGGPKVARSLGSTANPSVTAAMVANDPMHASAVATHYNTDSIAAGINYRKAFDNGVSLDGGFALLTSGTRLNRLSTNNGYGSDYAVNKQSIYRRVLAYTAGLMGAYRGFELGVQWLNNGKSQQSRNVFTDRTAGQGFATSAAYNFGPHKVAVGYYHFVRKLGTTPSTLVDGATAWAPYYTDGNISGVTALRNKDLGKAKLNGFTTVYTQKVAEGLVGFVEYGVLRMRISDNQYNLAKAQSAGAGGAGSNGKAVPSTTAQMIVTGLSLNF